MATELIFGERIGRTVPIRLTVTCALPDAQGRLLLVRRADNGQWVLPGGGVDSGERVVEAVVRETEEETGIHVKPVNLIGIYSNPDVIISYENGTRKYQVISIMFLCEPMYGEPRVTEETTEWGYFAHDSLPEPVAPTHLERIRDAVSFAGSVFVR
ncbi:MAG: NUDIX domain-containing protein [Chloroflexota bacterium]|nr:NUDIX domain-containing protein [Chloroflexota bacterium]